MLIIRTIDMIYQDIFRFIRVVCRVHILISCEHHFQNVDLMFQITIDKGRLFEIHQKESRV